MTRALPIIALCIVVSSAAAPETRPPGRGLVLADETVLFRSADPVFTRRQLETTSASTRAGLVAWLRTTEGRAWIEKWRSGEFEVVVDEMNDPESLGRAERPGIATLAALANPRKVKRFYVSLNPSIAAAYRSNAPRFAEIPSAEAAMAAAWAGEMLHVSFYAAGVVLPHHDRPDFQDRWLAVAFELGIPTVKHRSESEPPERDEERVGPRPRSRGRVAPPVP